MVLNLVHQASHGHVLPKVFFNTLVARSSLLHGSGLVEEGRQPCHVPKQGVEGHHAEGGRHHAMCQRLVSSTSCPVQVRKVWGGGGRGGDVGEEGEGEAMVLLCQESC